jgi:hypothetical protein
VATCSGREADDEIEFVTIMPWDSIDAIRALTGADYERAVLPEDTTGYATNAKLSSSCHRRYNFAPPLTFSPLRRTCKIPRRSEIRPTASDSGESEMSRLRIYEIDSFPNQMDRALWQTRWEASLLGAFGILALLIASVGLYGVISFAVNQRTREFGIRIALGAERHNAGQLVTANALTITLVGVGLALLLSLASTHLLRGFLYGLSPTDPTTYATVALLWTVVALVAGCSSVPMLVSTLSGVTSAAGIAEDVWAVASPATVMTVATSSAANTPSMNVRRVLFIVVSVQCFFVDLSISPTRPRSAAKSWRRTAQAGCRGAASGKSPYPACSESSCPV